MLFTINGGLVRKRFPEFRERIQQTRHARRGGHGNLPSTDSQKHEDPLGLWLTLTFGEEGRLGGLSPFLAGFEPSQVNSIGSELIPGGLEKTHFRTVLVAPRPGDRGFGRWALLLPELEILQTPHGHSRQTHGAYFTAKSFRCFLRAGRCDRPNDGD